MDSLTTFLVAHVGQADALLMESRQAVGLVAAVLAAMLAGQLGWHGTDRILARRERADD
ncbi:hypothetical protein ACQPZ8_44715 [Actinomadura nitritigenes]|uniref:hypothetical protein n=1 Tax=Actinomadura TaxID=1988 RepID=UPI0016895ADD|nr:hypothetical protein [Actinomadura sp. RB99]MBD2900262.1 hypothetical protein [Actinomadura sp. RB99]